MSVDKQELRRLAEAAIPDDWFKGGDLRYSDDKTGEVHGLNVEDERFIAAANPAAILSLLDELDSLHGAIDSPDEITAVPADDYDTLRKQFMSLLTMTNSKCRQVNHWRAQSSHVQQQEIWKNAANVNAERDTNAMLTDCLERAEAELEQCRKDAERYRAAIRTGLFIEIDKEEVDSAIDAAMAKEQSQ